MDADEARELAVAEFSGRFTSRGDLWQPDDWVVSGPTAGEVVTLRGSRPHWIFRFRRRDETEDRLPYLRVAVDRETGETDMLR